jgi:hypothetical protein
MVWSHYALAQEEAGIGQWYLREAARLNPSILEGDPSPYMQYLSRVAVSDEGRDHETWLRGLLSRLPREMMWLSRQCEWALGYGHLLRATRALMWGRDVDGAYHSKHAIQRHIRADEAFMRSVAHELLAYEIEYGYAATRDVLKRLTPLLRAVGGNTAARWLTAHHSANAAHLSYGARRYRAVPGRVLEAIYNRPGNLSNRGLQSILLRSIVRGHLRSEASQ